MKLVRGFLVVGVYGEPDLQIVEPQGAVRRGINAGEEPFGAGRGAREGEAWY